MTKKILVVDDDKDVIASLRFQLGRRFEIETANGVDYGVKAILQDGPYAVVLSDLRMPHMDGIRFLTWVESQSPDTVRIMMTAYADLEVAMTAINDGHVFRFLTKPCAPRQLFKALEDGIRQHELVEVERTLLQDTLSGSIRLLTELLALSDDTGFSRAQRTRDYINTLLPDKDRRNTWEMEVAAMLSDIGTITIPDSVIAKVQEGAILNKIEEGIYNRIPHIGHNLLANIPRLNNVARIVLYRHKHFDGTGIPKDSVAGPDLPYESRVLKVIGDLVELEFKGMLRGEAFQELLKRDGWYDPEIIQKLSDLPAIKNGPPVTAHTRASRVGVSDLRPGLVLKEPIITARGLRLVNQGSLISAPMLEKIRNHAELTGIREPIEILPG